MSLLLASSVGAREDSTRGYVIPLIHQDIGYTDAASVTLERMAACLKAVMPELKDHSDWCFWWENVYTLKCVLKAHPELRNRVKDLLKRGQLGVGAEWAGMDATLVPGESLVRMVTLAKQWMKRELDYEPTVASMNDMSGFGPQMAQVYAKAGVDFFFYTRGWKPPQAKYFHCVGLDGSKVLACKATAPKQIKGVEDVGYDGFAMFSGLGMFVKGQYKGQPTEVEVQEARRELIELNQALDPELWQGGVFWGMLNGGGDNRCPNLPVVSANIEKWNQATDPLTGKIRFQFGQPDAISRRIRWAVAQQNPEQWIFYLQPWPVQMRQERTFYYLSKAESNLLTAEKVACLVEILGLGRFPAEELEVIWADKLLWVYEHNWGGKEDRGGSDLEKKAAAYEAMRNSKVLLDSKMQALASALKFRKPNPILVFNPLNWPRTDVTQVQRELPRASYVVVDANGNRMISFLRETGRGMFSDRLEYEISFLAQNVPSLGYQTYYIVPETTKSGLGQITVKDGRIENEYFSVALDQERGLWSIRDKRRKRELLPENHPRWFGQIVSEDVSSQPKGQLDGDPVLDDQAKVAQYIKWDQKQEAARPDGTVTIDRYYYLQKINDSTVMDLLKISKIETAALGNLGARAVIHGQIEHSQVRMAVELWSQIPRIDFKLEMDYEGAAPRLLYASLPLETGQKTKNTIGVSYGAITNHPMKEAEHDTHRILTSGFSQASRGAKGYIGAGWTDPTTARFAQKWADVSAADDCWGITLVLPYNHTPVFWNGESLYLGLLRSLTRHDADKAKKGYHQVAFSLVCHDGNWKTGRAYRKGWEGSSPLAALAPPKSLQYPERGFLPETISFLRTKPDNFVLSVLTQSGENGYYIMRGYEAEDRSQTVELEFDPLLACKRACKTDLMENQLRQMPTSQKKIPVDLGNYEIITIKLRLTTD